MSQAAASLTSRTTRAAQWRLAASVSGAVSQFAIGVVLARLLPPADFGVMALAWVVLGLVRPFGDLGIGNAVVQRAGLSERHVRTGFTLAILFGVAMTAVVAALGRLASLLLHDARVTPVVQWLSLTFALQGFAVVAGALLRRKLDFRKLFVIESSSYVVGNGAVAISLALMGYGVWSLVWGGLAQVLLLSSALLLAVRHSVKPLLGRSEAKELLHFGVGASLNAGVNYLALNADNFVVGRQMGAGNLGLYNRAYMLMSVPYTYAASAMSGVLFPAFSEVQAQTERMQRAYLLVTRFTALIAGAAMATMAIAAPHLIRGLYGPRWTGVVAPLQILCLAGYFRALYHLGGVVVQSVGKVYSEMRRQAVYAGLVIVGTVVGTRYGLRGVAVGVAIAILYMFVAIGQLALRVTHTNWRTYFRVQQGALLTAAATGAAAYGMRLLMEETNATAIVKAAAILAAAAVPWGLSMAWNLGQPEFEAMRSSFPRWAVRAIEAVARRGGSRAKAIES